MLISTANSNTKEIILVGGNLADGQPPTGVINSAPPLLLYGGFSVAIILAIAFFTQVQLNAIAQLFKTIFKNEKK
jgi:hypothetical protein